MRALLASMVLLTTHAVAQTPPCESRNDAIDTLSTGITASPFGGLNPSRYAYQFAATATNVVEAAATITDASISGGYMRIEIWSSDDANQLPVSTLARGSCRLDADLQWYGVNFDIPIILNAGTNYWFVVAQPGFVRLFEQPRGTTLHVVSRPAARPIGPA